MYHWLHSIIGLKGLVQHTFGNGKSCMQIKGDKRHKLG